MRIPSKGPVIRDIVIDNDLPSTGPHPQGKTRIKKL